MMTVREFTFTHNAAGNYVLSVKITAGHEISGPKIVETWSKSGHSRTSALKKADRVVGEFIRTSHDRKAAVSYEVDLPNTLFSQ